MAYSTEDDLNAIFGPDNIQAWADLDNDDDADKIDARITAAIAVADAQIDDFLRGSHYTVPIANDAGSTPTSITDLSARYAGVWLYESRGVENFDENTGRPLHLLAWHRSHVYRALREIREGVRRIDAE